MLASKRTSEELNFLIPCCPRVTSDPWPFTPWLSRLLFCLLQNKLQNNSTPVHTTKLVMKMHFLSILCSCFLWLKHTHGPNYIAQLTICFMVTVKQTLLPSLLTTFYHRPKCAHTNILPYTNLYLTLASISSPVLYLSPTSALWVSWPKTPSVAETSVSWPFQNILLSLHSATHIPYPNRHFTCL